MWVAFRAWRIAALDSGVIQLRRPISSSGPQGLFETFSPSRSRIGSYVSFSSVVAKASSSDRGDGGFGERPVELGPAVVEEAHLVLAGAQQQVLLARER